MSHCLVLSVLIAHSVCVWGCSSVGRASALQAGGQEFDSPHLHQSFLKMAQIQHLEKYIAILNKLDRKEAKIKGYKNRINLLR